MIRVTDQGTGMSYRATGATRHRPESFHSYRGALSYITGSHALKVGLSTTGMAR